MLRRWVLCGLCHCEYIFSPSFLLFNLMKTQCISMAKEQFFFTRDPVYVRASRCFIKDVHTYKTMKLPWKTARLCYNTNKLVKMSSVISFPGKSVHIQKSKNICRETRRMYFEIRHPYIYVNIVFH